MCDRPWETMTDADFEAMLARSVGATVLGTLVGVAAIAFQEQFGAFTTAEPAFGVVIFGQG